MNGWAAPSRQRRRSIQIIAGYALLATACLTLAYLAARIALKLTEARPDALSALLPLWTVLPAAGVYLLGHSFRILRLALLVGGWRVGFRTIANLHLMTSAVSLAVPLKLGDAYRMAELSGIAGGWVRAIAIVWWERAFDISSILLILIVALAQNPGAAPEFLGVAVTAAMFIMGTAVAFFVLPDNLRRLSLLIIRRYTSKQTVPILRLIDLLHRAIREVPRLVVGKTASVATLTALIWMCEITCFAIMLPLLHGSLAGAPDALLRFLSSITLGQTLLGELENIPFLGTHTLPYLLATQVPLAFIGLIAVIPYVAHRIRAR